MGTYKHTIAISSAKNRVEDFDCGEIDPESSWIPVREYHDWESGEYIHIATYWTDPFYSELQ